MKLILLTLVVCCITLGCGLGYGSDKSMDENKSQQEVDALIESIRADISVEELKILYTNQQPIFMDLQYIDYKEIETYGEPYESYLPDFTWWFVLSVDYDSAYNQIMEEYSVELPYVENMKGRRYVVSLGRKLKQLYYYELSNEYTYNNAYIGRPIFEEEYYPLTIFFYTINHVDRFGFDNEICTPDMGEFNTKKNVPYEVQPFEPMGGMGAMPIDNPEVIRRRLEEQLWSKHKAEQEEQDYVDLE